MLATKTRASLLYAFRASSGTHDAPSTVVYCYNFDDNKITFRHVCILGRPAKGAVQSTPKPNPMNQPCQSRFGGQTTALLARLACQIRGYTRGSTLFDGRTLLLLFANLS